MATCQQSVYINGVVIYGSDSGQSKSDCNCLQQGCLLSGDLRVTEQHQPHSRQPFSHHNLQLVAEKGGRCPTFTRVTEPLACFEFGDNLVKIKHNLWSC